VRAKQCKVFVSGIILLGGVQAAFAIDQGGQRGKIDPATGKPEASTEGNPGGWIGQDDYPQGAEAIGNVIYIKFSISVDPDGKAASCTILKTGGDPKLDAATCRLLRVHGKFHPALDPSGNAVPGTWSRSVRWVKPNFARENPGKKSSGVSNGEENTSYYFRPSDYPSDALRIGAEGSVTVSIRIGANGLVTDCQVSQSSGNASLDAKTCEIASTRIPLVPAKDENRNPIVSWITLPAVKWVLP
jgi:TonB family protein